MKGLQIQIVGDHGPEKDQLSTLIKAFLQVREFKVANPIDKADEIVYESRHCGLNFEGSVEIRTIGVG